MAYAVIADITARLGSGESYTDAQVTAALNEATTRIDLYMEESDYFTAQTETVTEKAWGGQYLYFETTAKPLITAISITIETTSEPTTEFTYESKYHRLYWDDTKGNFNENDDVIIIGSFGWSQTPIDIKECCIRLALMILEDEDFKKGLSHGQIQGVTTDEIRVSFTHREEGYMSTGLADVDRVLEKYRKSGGLALNML